MDHSKTAKLNCDIEGDQAVVIVDDVLMKVPDNCIPVNTSNFAKLFALDEESRVLTSELFGLSKKKPVSIYYTMVGGSRTTQGCEIGYSLRSMNGNVGAELYIAHACGFMVEQHSKQIDDIIIYIASRYRGEVAIGLDEDGVACRVVFGHMPHFMAIYAEFCTGEIDALIDFIAHDDAECPVFKRGVALMSAVTKHPYPNLDASKAHIRAEIEAEKHLWRMPYGLVFVAAWSDSEPDSHGTCFSQCRKRIFRTIKRMRKHDDYLCYRTDIGYSLQFSLATDQYKALQR